jgi:valyl-tRNA synthetase
MRYADEDFGHNCGEYTFQAGDLVEEYTPEGGSNEAHELAADIQGSPEWFLDRLYEIEAETADELEDYEINSIRYVYDKGVLDEFPKVVLEVMEQMAVQDENYEFAERIKNTIAVNEE